LPWNAIMSASPERIQFLGRLHPAFLALVPIGLALSIRGPLRRVALAALVATAVWAIGPQWIRYLLPALPLLAWIGGAAAGVHPIADVAVARILLGGGP